MLIDRDVSELFRRGISRADPGDIFSLLLEDPCDVEIDQRHLVILVDHNVGRLHVTVHYGRLPGMNVGQHICELACPFQYSSLVEPVIFAEHHSEITAAYKIHDRVDASFVDKIIQDLRYPLMPQLFQNVYLRPPVVRSDGTFLDLLQDDPALKVRVIRPVYNTAPAFSDAHTDDISSMHQCPGHYLLCIHKILTAVLLMAALCFRIRKGQ